MSNDPEREAEQLRGVDQGLRITSPNERRSMGFARRSFTLVMACMAGSAALAYLVGDLLTRVPPEMSSVDAWILKSLIVSVGPPIGILVGAVVMHKYRYFKEEVYKLTGAGDR